MTYDRNYQRSGYLGFNRHDYCDGHNSGLFLDIFHVAFYRLLGRSLFYSRRKAHVKARLV